MDHAQLLHLGTLPTKRHNETFDKDHNFKDQRLFKFQIFCDVFKLTSFTPNQ